MNRYRWLLLDADNTLFDFDVAEALAFEKLALHYGLARRAEAKALYEEINSRYWAAFDRGEISQETLVTARFDDLLKALDREGDGAEWNRYYLDALADTPVLLPGAEALCRRLTRRYTLALVTNGVPHVQRRRLEGSPLGKYFGKRVFISGEMGCRKPEAEFFDKTLRELGAWNRKGEVLVIGDSLSSDIRGAFNARLDSVWYNPKRKAPGVIRPTYEVEHFSELAGLLEV